MGFERQLKLEGDFVIEWLFDFFICGAPRKLAATSAAALMLTNTKHSPPTISMLRIWAEFVVVEEGILLVFAFVRNQIHKFQCDSSAAFFTAAIDSTIIASLECPMIVQNRPQAI